VKKSIFIVVLGLIVLTAFSSAAQDKGYWPASSNTAKSITGDIAISDAKLVINFAGFPMVQARDLKPAEVSAVFDADINVGRTGFLYHLTVPGTKRFCTTTPSAAPKTRSGWQPLFRAAHSRSPSFPDRNHPSLPSMQSADQPTFAAHFRILADR